MADAVAGVVAHCEDSFARAEMSPPIPRSLGYIEYDDKEDLWAKAERGEPLTEAEIDRL